MAVSIILNDIRMTVYDSEQYEPLETTENGDKFIPSSLKRFLHNLLDCNGKSRSVPDRRCTAIAHAIICANRPRSFISPLLLGLSMYTHHTVCLPWTDWHPEQHELCRWLQSGTTVWTSPYVRWWPIMTSGFTQFVFDNADFNVATLTGHNTFHGMGGIA